MRPNDHPTSVLIVGAVVVILIYSFWPYLIAGLALIGLYHLWTQHPPK